VKTRLLELAEEPGIWTPFGPGAEVVAGVGYQVVLRGHRSGTVERIRLDDDGVARALEETRRLARERDLERVVWWIGELTTPTGLSDRLLALGLTPDPDTPAMTTVAITAEPAGEATVEVHRVADLDGFLRALEIDWEVWGLDAGTRRRLRARAPEHWDAIAGDPRIEHYLALLDREPVGFARGVFSAWAGILMGGSTLAHARGRGVYTSLVQARWHDAVARDAPRLTAAAGPSSTPILERLGFERIGGVRLVRDGVVGSTARTP
jgi:hypothetical protein